MKGKERMVLPDKRKLRNLKQYKDLSDEEFDEIWEEKLEEIEVTPEMLEERISERLDELAEDYDMEDMKSNDRIQLRALVLAMIQLEDLEQTAWTIRQKTGYQDVQILEKINKILGGLRDDISKISNDLQLTRKIRKQSRETTVLDWIADLRGKAHKFYKHRMLYIFCPECKMLLSTIWLNYNSEKKNSIKLKCRRCEHEFTQDLAPLYETDNKNIEEIVLP